MISAAATVGSTRTPWSATWPIVGRSPAPIRRTAWTYSAEISGPTIAESISARIRNAETLSLPWPNGVAPVAARTISSYGATTPSARTANSNGWRRYSPSASVMIWRIDRGVCSWGELIAEAYASRLSNFATRSRCASVVKHIGSANSSIAIACSQRHLGAVAKQRLAHREHVRRAAPRSARTRRRARVEQLVVGDELVARARARTPRPPAGADRKRTARTPAGSRAGGSAASCCRPRAPARSGRTPARSVARSESTSTSHASANASPTPAAAPLTAAMNALSVRVISRAIPPNWSRIQRQISVAAAGRLAQLALAHVQPSAAGRRRR